MDQKRLDLLEKILFQLQDCEIISLRDYSTLERYIGKTNKRYLLQCILTITSERIPIEIVREIEELLRLERNEKENNRIKEREEKIEGKDIEREQKGIVDSTQLNPFVMIKETKITIWGGDITTLEIDAIVNAANSAMLGCFQINHPCIGENQHTI